MGTTYNAIVGRNERNMYLLAFDRIKKNSCFWKFAEAVALSPP
jgi:hypothetical protein